MSWITLDIQSYPWSCVCSALGTLPIYRTKNAKMSLLFFAQIWTIFCPNILSGYNPYTQLEFDCNVLILNNFSNCRNLNTFKVMFLNENITIIKVNSTKFSGRISVETTVQYFDTLQCIKILFSLYCVNNYCICELVL